MCEAVTKAFILCFRCRHTNKRMDSVIFSTCTVRFNSKNWNKAQRVVVKAVENFKTDDKRAVYVGLDILPSNNRIKRQLGNFKSPFYDKIRQQLPGFEVSISF